MTIVQHTLVNPRNGGVYGYTQVKVQLATNGYTASGHAEILGTSIVTTDATGLYQIDLVPQSQINPLGTHYQVTHPSGEVLSFVVSDLTGPLWLSTLLVTAPASPGPVLVAAPGLSKTAAAWASDAGIYQAGALLTELDTGQDKIGDGVHAYASLPYTTAVEKARALAAEAALIPLSQKAVANGVATLDSSGLLPTTQLPPLAITDAYTVNSQAAMLGLAAHVGDVAIRSDLVPVETFILAAAPASTLANWVQITTPGAVTSVQGHVGAVSLVAGDIPDLSGTYGALSANNTWDPSNTHSQKFRGVLQIRANDAPLGAPSAPQAPICLKPSTDQTAAPIQGYHSSSNGFLIHFTGDGGAATTSDSGLIGLGVSGPETGLVIDNYAAGRGFGGTNEAGSTGPLMTFNNFGTGAVMEINSGGAGTGHLLTFAIPGTMPTTSRGIEFSSTTGSNPESWWIDSAMQMHLSAAGVKHETKYNLGSGFAQNMYVDTGASTFWSSAIQATTNVLSLLQAPGVAAMGFETFNTMLSFKSGTQMGFFGAAPVAKQGAAGILTGGYIAGTGTTLTLDGRVTGTVGSTAYSINDIVAALKNYGLLTA